MAAVTETGSMYSAPVAFIYVFNLIIGVGALTMPKAFEDAGWLVATILVFVLCFMSFVTATFMFEAMAAGNALLRLKENEKDSKKCQEVTENTLLSNSSATDDDSNESSEEIQPLLNCTKTQKRPMNLYEITTKIEMGQMAKMFFSKFGLRMFYLCIVIYLYGDLAIYAAAVPKSLTQVACGTLGSEHSNNSSNHTHPEVNKETISSTVKCWGPVVQTDVYRIFLAVFTVCLGPFTFFNVQKTKYLQIFTTLMRWLAFIMMIWIAMARISSNSKAQTTKYVTVANISGIPNLFGVCVYSFMCQHSLPSLITPMKSKRRVTWLMLSDFSLVLLFYSLISFSAIFAFHDIEDLYTLNFWNISGKFASFYLALFPVFTLSTNFPIISITLRDNLKNLCYREGRPYHWAVDRIVFPLVTIVPPIIVAFATHNLEILVGVTGSYAGTGVQYVIPATLVYFGRKRLRAETGCYDNKHRSPFRQRSWLIFVMVWSLICIALVTVNHIITRK